MSDPLDTITVTISVNHIELLALKKLAIVSHALGTTIGGPAGREQLMLTSCLDALIRQIETKAPNV